jgi:hypothetical protein
MHVLKIIFGKYFSARFPLFPLNVRTNLPHRQDSSVCPDVPDSGSDMYFSVISYVALRPDGITDTLDGEPLRVKSHSPYAA